MAYLKVLVICLIAACAGAFSPVSTFTQRTSMSQITIPNRGPSTRTPMTMGKKAKFGPFSPAVYVAKAILGEKELNKVRGKAISYHSQAITEFCTFVGAASVQRARIIKLAKTNGDTLGFLV
mmetsp:Transcript_33968/g.43404  ORF Transcript_33968/g.43404 Transcript_33968/m.43404 type:complete len:122 (+) Transcript_33968:66-431(+)